MPFLLGSKALVAGFRVASFETIGSTSTEALDRARAGDPGRLWVVSSAQTAGHGRRGRHWATPSGNLAASLLVGGCIPPAEAARLGFVAGLALVEAIEAVTSQRGCAPCESSRQSPPPSRGRVPLALAQGAGEGGPKNAEPLARPSADAEGHPLPQGARAHPAPARAHAQLKWPNDVLVNGAKLAGILLEAVSMPGGESRVVIGMGVNVAHAPEDLPYPATSLAACGGRVSAAELFEALSESWVDGERTWDGGRGFAATRERWLARAAGLGAPIAVRTGEDVFRGVFETIDADGRLVVRAPQGAALTVTAGDVHFGLAATAGN